MSALDERVLTLVASIPSGHVSTYGAIAHVAGTSARTVGRILSRGDHEIPWWRVVDAQGRPFPGALPLARARLIEESTPLKDGGDDFRVDVERAFWTGRR